MSQYLTRLSGVLKPRDNSSILFVWLIGCLFCFYLFLTDHSCRVLFSPFGRQDTVQFLCPVPQSVNCVMCALSGRNIHCQLPTVCLGTHTRFTPTTMSCSRGDEQ